MNEFLQIPSLLKPAEINAIEALVKNGSFIDGRLTASLAAKTVKNNLQIDSSAGDVAQQIQAIVSNALRESPLFQVATLPHRIYPALISKYDKGRYYGWHVDSPIMGEPAMRTDLAMTIFMSDPGTYTGGELALQTNAGVLNFKPNKGDAVVYPCQYLHCVNEVTSGERLAIVTWIQSKVKSREQREILFNLNQVHAILHGRDMNSQEAIMLLQSHSNLLRMWTEL